MSEEKTYWAVIDTDSNIVELVNVCLGDAKANMESLYPNKIIAPCRLDANSVASPGYLYDQPTGWFIPPTPDFDDPEVYFDREIWKWHVPAPPDEASNVDTPTEEPETE